MKILQINNVYRNGSTGKITADINDELIRQGIDSVVCYGRGDKIVENNVYKICGEYESYVYHAWAKVSGVMYGGCPFSTNRLISIIKKEKPDIVHLQCINGYFVNIYRLIDWLKANRIRTVLTLHAEFMHTGGCGHSIDCNQWSTRNGCGHSEKCPRWRAETGSIFRDRTNVMWNRMRQSFNGFNDGLIITSVSPWLMDRAKQSPILEGKDHRVVLNGLDTEVFHLYDTEILREKHSLKDEKIIFHATPGFSLDPNHIKGGHYVNEIAKRFVGENVKFIVAGGYSEGIEVSDNIILLGKVTDQRVLASYYSLADITLLTSKKETFSMVTAESLCCGTPVVGFEAGAPEQIALAGFSDFVAHGDIDVIEVSIRRILVKHFEKKEISKKAKAIYSKLVMCEKYIEIYKELNSEGN